MTRTLLNQEKIDGLTAAIAAVRSVPGDFAELGVYRGGVARILANSLPRRTVRLFDTFTGIPWDGYDPTLDRHKPGEFPASLEQVRADLADCPNVIFHPGLFPHTAAGGQFALVHLDADLYASTLAGLEYFWPRLSVGGCIILDDWKWSWCPGVEQAVMMFFMNRNDHRCDESVANQLTVWKD